MFITFLLLHYSPSLNISIPSPAYSLLVSKVSRTMIKLSSHCRSHLWWLLLVSNSGIFSIGIIIFSKRSFTYQMDMVKIVCVGISWSFSFLIVVDGLKLWNILALVLAYLAVTLQVAEWHGENRLRRHHSVVLIFDGCWSCQTLKYLRRIAKIFKHWYKHFQHAVLQVADGHGEYRMHRHLMVVLVIDCRCWA